MGLFYGAGGGILSPIYRQKYAFNMLYGSPLDLDARTMVYYCKEFPRHHRKLGLWSLEARLRKHGELLKTIPTIQKQIAYLKGKIVKKKPKETEMLEIVT